MNSWEVLAASLGVINIVLIVRRSIWNFPFGIAMVSVSAWLFVQPDVRLYSDALLQVFFVVVQLYGWWSWGRAQAESGEIRVERLAPSAAAACLAAITVATLGWGSLMYRFTDAALPWWDAFIAMASVAAQLLMARRYLENWVLWIAVDCVAIGVYATKGLTLLALLYLVFLILSAVGLVSWQRSTGDRRVAAL